MTSEATAFHDYSLELLGKNKRRVGKVKRGQSHSTVVAVHLGSNIEVMCSGAKKFVATLFPNKMWRIKTVKGTTKEEAEDHISLFHTNLKKNRERKSGFKSIAYGISVNAEPCDESDKNFANALACGHYHKKFIDFCKANGLSCHFVQVKPKS